MKYKNNRRNIILLIIGLLFFSPLFIAASIPDISKEQGGLIVVLGSPDKTQSKSLIDLSKKRNWLIQVLETDSKKQQSIQKDFQR